MKKLLAIMLALVLCFSLAACGSDNSAIVDYVEENEEELVSSFEAAFTMGAGGMLTCDSSVEVEGMGFIITIKINELEDLDADTKAQIKEGIEATGSGYDSLIEQMQEELPDLEYFELVICEKDGDEIATVTVGEK